MKTLRHLALCFIIFLVIFGTVGLAANGNGEQAKDATNPAVPADEKQADKENTTSSPSPTEKQNADSKKIDEAPNGTVSFCIDLIFCKTAFQIDG